jgi:hypothetical protein
MTSGAGPSVRRRGRKRARAGWLTRVCADGWGPRGREGRRGGEYDWWAIAESGRRQKRKGLKRKVSEKGKFSFLFLI